MGSHVRSEDRDDETGEKDRRPRVMAHELTDRYVFTEAENTDGWIASDLTLEVEP